MARTVRFFESAEEVFDVYAPDYPRLREQSKSLPPTPMGKEAGAELARAVLRRFHARLASASTSSARGRRRPANTR